MTEIKHNLEILRAEEEWQRAGAYSVRIQGMNRQYHIPLREEGYRCIEIESRIEVMEFYRKQGFHTLDDQVVQSGCFSCVRMRKNTDQKEREK